MSTINNISFVDRHIQNNEHVNSIWKGSSSNRNARGGGRLPVHDTRLFFNRKVKVIMGEYIKAILEDVSQRLHEEARYAALTSVSSTLLTIDSKQKSLDTI